MRRGVTSTIRYTLPQNVQVSDVVEARISICQAHQKIIEHSLSEMVIDTDENTLGVNLTQVEALRLSESRPAEVQLKVKIIGGSVLATPISEVQVHDILNEDVL